MKGTLQIRCPKGGRGGRVRPIRVQWALDGAARRCRCECTWQREQLVRRPGSESGFGAAEGLSGGGKGWPREGLRGQVTWGLEGHARCLAFISRALGSHGRDLSQKAIAQRRDEGEGGSGRSQGSVCGLRSGVGVGPTSEARNQGEGQVFGDSGVIPALETLGWRGPRVGALREI